MLNISAKQWSHLGHQVESDFQKRAIAFLEARHAEACAGMRGQLPHLLDSARRLAQLCALESEIAVITICELVLVHGPAFHRNCAWAHYILKECPADDAERVARLREYLP